MPWADGFIAVDWGTTNRRGYLLAPDGSLVDETEDDRGILSVPAGGFPAAVEQLRRRLGDKPMMMAGMVGSNRGWVEAAYAPCPAGLDALAAGLAWPEEGRVAIVPGVAQQAEDADVMRGEETQLLGAAAAGDVPADCLVCHPGTHNKWVRMQGGRIASFRTVMTGELFSLLRERSILADLLADAAVDDAGEGEAFDRGVAEGLRSDALMSDLFSVRARVLLGRLPRAEAGAYINGLLIGHDLRVGLRLAEGGDQVIVMGRPSLTALFARALRAAGRDARELDGERAFLHGARAIAERVA